MALKTLRNVEIFRVGEWKGEPYTTDDLDEMARSFQTFKSSWFLPALKLGHGESPGQEASGYLDNIRRKGDLLMADFVDLQVETYTAIKQRKYDRVSLEIMPKLKREGKVYHNVVWSIALLGVEVPEVSGLKPLRAALATLSSDVEAISLQTTLAVPDDNDSKQKEKKEMNVNQNDKDKKPNPPEPKDDRVVMSADVLKMQSQLKEQADQITKLSADLDASTKHAHKLEEKRRAERIEQKVSELRVPALRTYAKVFYDWATKESGLIKFSKDDKEVELSPESLVDEFVSTMNNASESLFSVSSNESTFVRDDQPKADNPGEEIDRRVKVEMSKQKDLDYSAAQQLVFSKDPELKKQYALN